MDAPLAYDEFGVPLAGMQENPHNPFGFTGYQMDNVSGLFYAEARYYQPTMGRFAAEDGARDGLNWYVHCRSNPLSFFDPTGLARYKINDGHAPPKLKHDKGFPHNPEEEPNWKDHASSLIWFVGVNNTSLALPDGVRAYNHYRGGTGTDLVVDYQRAYNQDKGIKSAIDQEIERMKQFAESALCNDAGSSLEIIGTVQKIGNPENVNWLRTIGKHKIYGHGIVTTNEEGRTSMDITFYMEDVCDTMI